MFIISSPNQKIVWTSHSRDKMRYYRLSEQRIKRVLRNPLRVEEGVAPRTIAVMQPAGSKKHTYEIWVMYQLTSQKSSPFAEGFGGCPLKFQRRRTKVAPSPKLWSVGDKSQKLRIISAWRYPGKSPKRNPIPQKILQEIQSLVNS